MVLSAPEVETWVESQFGHYQVVSTPAQLADCIRVVSRPFQESLAVDFEATDKDPVTAIPLLLQIALDDEHTGPYAYVVVLPVFTKEQLAPLMAALVQKPVIGANLAYEYKMLKHHYGVELTRLWDTQLAEQVGTSGDYATKKEWLPAVSLKAVALKYLGIELSKEERQTFLTVVPDETWRPTEEQATYAALDVLILHELARRQSRQMETLDLVRSVQLRFQALPAICDMELRGMRIDQDAWRGFLKEVEAQLVDLDRRLQVILSPFEWTYRKEVYQQKVEAKARWERERDIALEYAKAGWAGLALAEGEDKHPWGAYKTAYMQRWREEHPNPGTPHYDDSLINLGSSQQVKRAFAGLGLVVTKTDKLTRQRLLRDPDLDAQQREVLEVFGERTRLAKLQSSFGEKILARIRPETGRLSAQVNIHLTDTGRMSMEKPNLQQIPREATLRNAFIAETGFLVVTADYSGQELAVSAALSRDPQMQADVNARRDLYKELAVQVFKLTSPAEVTKEQRQQCKNALLGITYGLSAKGMEARYFIPKKRAQALLDGVRTRYPVFVAWSDEQVAIAKRDYAVRTAVGTKRFFKGYPPEDEWKWGTEPRNAPVQGTAADIVYRLAARLKRALPAPAYVGNIVHDEVVGVVPAERAQADADLIVREMQTAFNDILPVETYGVTVGVDVHIAPYWTKD